MDEPGSGLHDGDLAGAGDPAPPGSDAPPARRPHRQPGSLLHAGLRNPGDDHPPDRPAGVQRAHRGKLPVAVGQCRAGRAVHDVHRLRNRQLHANGKLNERYRQPRGFPDALSGPLVLPYRPFAGAGAHRAGGAAYAPERRPARGGEPRRRPRRPVAKLAGPRRLGRGRVRRVHAPVPLAVGAA